jgi:hypothetical protein
MKAQIPISATPDCVEKGNSFLDIPQEPHTSTSALLLVPSISHEGLIVPFCKQGSRIDGIVENDRIRINPEDVVVIL